MLAFAALALAGFARAELGANDTNTLKEFFDNALLDPLFANNFTTEGLLSVTWAASNTSISPGKPLNGSIAKDFTHDMAVTPAPNATGFNETNLYTVILFDAQNTNTNITGNNTQNLHWLINNIHLNQSVEGGPFPLLLENATTVKDFQGPAPPAGDGPHRYVWLVYGQPANFTPPTDYATAGQIKEVKPFDFVKYVDDAKLGPIVGSTFFTVETGNSTIDLAPTQTSNASLAAATNVVSSGSDANGTGTSTDGNSTSSDPANPTATEGSNGFATLPALGFTFLAAAVAALI